MVQITSPQSYAPALIGGKNNISFYVLFFYANQLFIYLFGY